MPQRPDILSIETHLETALERTDNDVAKYHIREASQKCIATAATLEDTE